ncbi:cyanophycinase, partial [uncultured Amaricoccus sp.]
MADQPASLALIGGRLEDSNIAIYGEMHRLSGGRILVFPTASAEPKAVGQETLAVFRTHGFDADVIPLTPANARRLAHDPTLIARVADVGSIYFTGGDQAKITASLAGTPLLAAIRALPGLVAGSSAGAAIMSDPMILGGTSIEAVVHGVTDDPETQGLLLGAGLGFFAHGMVDQHFIKRGRLGRLVVAMARAGVRRGFGIDENTALLVE